MNINDDIATNLSRFLSERNISASAAAKIGGVTASTITRFLSREIKSLNIETIQKIAAHYDEPILRFINGGNAGVYPNAEILTDIFYIDFYNDIG
ncbi:MAG: helix-turn-helix transcriptional regulator, partial [Mucispirillum sp.]|nr:helix-turn-helix transcriptional regulator [Mucispirillum sp.]